MIRRWGIDSNRHRSDVDRRALALVLSIAVVMMNCGSGRAEEISFNRDIRPILSEHCFRCHGFDASQREAGLRLDTRDAAIAEIDGGTAAIVPGDVEASEMISRITSAEDSVVMPPSHLGKPLDFEQIELLKRWVDQGALYDRHWSFMPPMKPQLPDVASAWCSNPIDHFVLARLERAGLEPSPPAKRETLLRRLSLDLTGLPPSLAELDRFLEGDFGEAYTNAVDRLLASQRYGEHRARYWLDAARYGDTHGMARDDERAIWPYRDWVIRAFNDNLPFDQFTIRQIAGDLLADPSTDDLVATGFVRCNVSTAEGGSIDEELVVTYARDRVDTFSTVWMGLTMACAACHDHKYDPLSQEEYYQLTAFFNNLDEEPMNGNAMAPSPVVEVPSVDQAAALRRIERAELQLKERIAGDEERHLDHDFQHWISSSATDFGRTLATQVSEASSWLVSKSFHRHNNTAIYNDEDFGPEQNPDLENESYGWQSKPEWENVPIQVSDDNAAKFYYREFEAGWPHTVKLNLSSDEQLWKPVRWKVWLNGELIYFRQFRQADVPFAVDLPIDLRRGHNSVLVRVSHFGGPLRGRIELKGPSMSATALRRDVLAVADRSATAVQRANVKEYFRKHLWNRRRGHATEMQRLSQQRFAVVGELPVSMICRERAESRPTYLLDRGQYDREKQRVSRGVPSVFPPVRNDANRLDLAQWLVSGEHPLTARVAVNRIWEQFFGFGLVKTTEDFGAQGDWPSHPQLLDWLAVDFQEHRWNVKRLIRQIVTSSTYQQSSVVRPTHRSHDPQNRLLSRGPRFRLDAEVIRDQALLCGGLLAERLGGRSVKPPQPSGLWLSVSQPNSSTAHFVADLGDARFRRSLYTFWKRTSPPPVLQTFDAPTRDSCVVRRERTNTPLQALLVMNEEQYFLAAKGLAGRMQSVSKDLGVEAGLKHGFRTVTSRVPETNEMQSLRLTHERLRSHYRSHPLEASKIAGDVTDGFESAAWIITANLLLNLSEVVTKE